MSPFLHNIAGSQDLQTSVSSRVESRSTKIETRHEEVEGEKSFKHELDNQSRQQESKASNKSGPESVVEKNSTDKPSEPSIKQNVSQRQNTDGATIEETLAEELPPAEERTLDVSQVPVNATVLPEQLGNIAVNVEGSGSTGPLTVKEPLSEIGVLESALGSRNNDLTKGSKGSIQALSAQRMPLAQTPAKGIHTPVDIAPASEFTGATVELKGTGFFLNGGKGKSIDGALAKLSVGITGQELSSSVPLQDSTFSPSSDKTASTPLVGLHNTSMTTNLNKGQNPLTVDKLLASNATNPTNSNVIHSPSTLNVDEGLNITDRLAVLSSLSEKVEGSTDTRQLFQQSVSTQYQMETTARTQIPVNIRFGQPQWATAIAERTAMIASQNIQFAELQLDPPELGPLQVKVSIHQDQASVSFVSANQAVRESVDQSIIKLKELFEEQGLDLVDVDVSDHSFNGQEPEAQDEQFSDGAETSDVQKELTTEDLVLDVSQGIDFFA